MAKTKRTKTNKTERKREREKAGAILPAEIIPAGELTPRQYKAIEALLEAPTITAAAQAAGIARVTLYEWLKLEPFRAALDAARAAIYREGVDTLKGAAGLAAGRLIELLNSRNENTRRLTAHQILTLAIRIDENQTLEKRLTALEQALEASRPRSGDGLPAGGSNTFVAEYGNSGK